MLPRTISVEVVVTTLEVYRYPVSQLLQPDILVALDDDLQILGVFGSVAVCTDAGNLGQVVGLVGLAVELSIEQQILADLLSGFFITDNFSQGAQNLTGVGSGLGQPDGFRDPVAGAVQVAGQLGLSEFHAVDLTDEGDGGAFAVDRSAGTKYPMSLASVAIGNIADLFLQFDFFTVDGDIDLTVRLPLLGDAAASVSLKPGGLNRIAAILIDQDIVAYANGLLAACTGDQGAGDLNGSTVVGHLLLLIATHIVDVVMSCSLVSQVSGLLYLSEFAGFLAIRSNDRNLNGGVVVILAGGLVVEDGLAAGSIGDLAVSFRTILQNQVVVGSTVADINAGSFQRNILTGSIQLLNDLGSAARNTNQVVLQNACLTIQSIELVAVFRGIIVISGVPNALSVNLDVDQISVGQIIAIFLAQNITVGILQDLNTIFHGDIDLDAITVCLVELTGCLKLLCQRSGSGVKLVVAQIQCVLVCVEAIGAVALATGLIDELAEVESVVVAVGRQRTDLYAVAFRIGSNSAVMANFHGVHGGLRGSLGPQDVLHLLIGSALILTGCYHVDGFVIITVDCHDTDTGLNAVFHQRDGAHVARIDLDCDTKPHEIVDSKHLLRTMQNVAQIYAAVPCIAIGSILMESGFVISSTIVQLDGADRIAILVPGQQHIAVDLVLDGVTGTGSKITLIQDIQFKLTVRLVMDQQICVLAGGREGITEIIALDVIVIKVRDGLRLDQLIVMVFALIVRKPDADRTIQQAGIDQPLIHDGAK